jgi:alginate O-acetyltransferase complex protein AlgI
VLAVLLRLVEPSLSGPDCHLDDLQFHRRHNPGQARRPTRKPAAIAVWNRGQFGADWLFKYANFFVENANALAGTSYDVGTILLPLAISFFTFQQITFLVDSHAGKTKEYDLLRYCLFVTFFPQLIAGPIVHHAEMMPQFARRTLTNPKARNIAIGLTIFALGLFKKAVLADGIAPFADSTFADAERGVALDAVLAWSGALAYTFQLYFDFSGYSDMAIGLARLFGITLPLNFNSPYKAGNIIDFWRCWHMTLSRFLRDYIYIPLGGNRRGLARRHTNLLATMLIGGLWHGAGWTFVVWGGLHGLYLMINHAWRWGRPRLGLGEAGSAGWVERRLAHGLTFIAVVIAWVFFRALTFDGAITMLEGMAGMNGVSLPAAIAHRMGGLAETLQGFGVQFNTGGGNEFLLAWGWIMALAAIAFLLPNTQEIMRRYRPALDFGRAVFRSKLDWRPTPGWIVVSALLFALGILSLPEVSVFLYFQF